MIGRWRLGLARAPFPVWALAVCLLAALYGILIIDDYAIVIDAVWQRAIGNLTLDYVLGRSNELLSLNGREYGVAFELPLILAERALGLEDSRSIYLLRHLLTHLFFIAGAFFAALLAWRMTGSRWLGLFALLLFLLHPRLYAHSFVNSKDLPFLSMFMVALYFTHRAFRRDTLGAFILCGVAVGLLTNIRIMGLMLFPAVIVMRSLDFGYEFHRPERRRRVLLTAGAFALAAILTLYATWPWLWGDPLSRFAEAFSRMANFPYPHFSLFQGEPTAHQSPPWNYIPVWLGLTTPPAALLLAAAGGAAALGRGLAQPGEIFRNTPRRFEGLLLACLILPVAAVIVLDSTLYNDWRQMYFLYAPLCLLAVGGLQGLLAGAGRVRLLPGRVFGGRKVPGGATAVRAAVYGLAGIALFSAALQLLQLHPFQGLYFNLLADRRTPEYLGSQYDLRPWPAWVRPGLEHLLERYPEETLRIRAPFGRGFDGSKFVFPYILPPKQRERLETELAANEPADFFIANAPNYVVSGGAAALFPPSIYTLQVYRNTVLNIGALDLSRVDDAGAALHRERYQSVVAGEPVIRAEFDVYLQGRTLSWVQDPCDPAAVGWGMELALYPAEPRHLPPHQREQGFVRGPRLPLVRFDGKCFAQTTLPDYELTRFRTGIGRFDPATGARLGTWVGHYYPGRPEVMEAIARRRQSEPPPGDAAQWEVFRDGQRLLYAKAGCAPADREAMFFLHLTPANPEDLPGDRRKYGYDNLDFPFAWRGLAVGDECIIVAPLPDYPIAAINTGQYTGAGRLWETTLPRQ